MGFCSPTEYQEFMRQCPEVERMLVRSGIRLFKYWFSVSREEQRRRFEARKDDPLKQWKLSPIDLARSDKWDDYTEAKEAMFFYTDTADAPWTVVKSDDKKRARLNCMSHFLWSLPYPNKDLSIVRCAGPADRRLDRTCHRPRSAHPGRIRSTWRRSIGGGRPSAHANAYRSSASSTLAFDARTRGRGAAKPRARRRSRIEP